MQLSDASIYVRCESYFNISVKIICNKINADESPPLLFLGQPDKLFNNPPIDMLQLRRKAKILSVISCNNT